MLYKHTSLRSCSLMKLSHALTKGNFYFPNMYLFPVCVRVHCIQVEVKGQLASSLLLPCGLNSSHQAMPQAPLPAEPP